MDYQQIINKYYGEDDALRHILVVHSQQVMRKALAIADTHPHLHLDRQFLEEAAMVHDIGICQTHAPGIHCHGSEHYIRHGVLGAEIMRAEGYERHARVCERHTGAGLSLEDILRQDLPLPHHSLLPETLEEQVICYADKFFSKSHLDQEKTLPQAERSLAKFGEEGLLRFRHWHDLFG